MRALRRACVPRTGLASIIADSSPEAAAARLTAAGAAAEATLPSAFTLRGSPSAVDARTYNYVPAEGVDFHDGWQPEEGGVEWRGRGEAAPSVDPPPPRLFGGNTNGGNSPRALR